MAKSIDEMAKRIGKDKDMAQAKGNIAMKTPPVVSQQEWEAARQQLLAKEKALTRARDALAAERRRMPWVAVEKVLAGALQALASGGKARERRKKPWLSLRIGTRRCQ